jgi:hypothetical protein
MTMLSQLDRGWEAKGPSHIMALTRDGLTPSGPKYTGYDSTGKPWGDSPSRHCGVKMATYLGLDVPCREAEVPGNILDVSEYFLN